MKDPDKLPPKHPTNFDKHEVKPKKRKKSAKHNRNSVPPKADQQ